MVQKKRLMKDAKQLGNFLECLKVRIKRKNLLLTKFNTLFSKQVFHHMLQTSPGYDFKYIHGFLYMNRMLFIEVLSSPKIDSLSTEELGLKCQKENLKFRKYRIRKDDMRFWESEIREIFLKKMEERGIQVPAYLSSLSPSKIFASSYNADRKKVAMSNASTSSIEYLNSDGVSIDETNLSNTTIDLDMKTEFSDGFEMHPHHGVDNGIEFHPNLDSGTKTCTVVDIGVQTDPGIFVQFNNSGSGSLPNVNINFSFQFDPDSSRAGLSSGNSTNLRISEQKLDRYILGL
ncbi:uncharacterized protein [Venturia canescens]|uniref:uncharacterized protein isoform X2 n=1 Tax=Venturia canescens TaxID=32260 RepID=UPI001C9BE0F0|nr:uncharacterized protein LOC122418152 isoform X2 [Venturia canescens]